MERETEGEKQIKTKSEEDKEHLSPAAFPLPFLSEYFLNKLNPALDYKSLGLLECVLNSAWVEITPSYRTIQI